MGPATTGAMAEAGVVAAIFAAVHVFSPRLVFLDRTPRSIWLSVAGGVSVAYVFIHLLPELSHRQRHAVEGVAAWAEETGLFVLAMLGLVIFYGLERLAARRHTAAINAADASAGTFWLHLVSFGLYAFLIAYLLDEQARRGVVALTVYAIAMGLHYVVNDRALYGRHGRRYVRAGRWLLAAMTLAGWASGLFFLISEIWLAAAFAFLAGGIIFNVIKEELPEERESRFSAFALGAVAYAVLLHFL